MNTKCPNKVKQVDYIQYFQTNIEIFAKMLAASQCQWTFEDFLRLENSDQTTDHCRIENFMANTCYQPKAAIFDQKSKTALIFYSFHPSFYRAA